MVWSLRGIPDTTQCYICLDSENTKDNPLMRQGCNCNTVCHQQCGLELAKTQIAVNCSALECSVCKQCFSGLLISTMMNTEDITPSGVFSIRTELDHDTKMTAIDMLIKHGDPIDMEGGLLTKLHIDTNSALLRNGPEDVLWKEMVDAVALMKIDEFRAMVTCLMMTLSSHENNVEHMIHAMRVYRKEIPDPMNPPKTFVHNDGTWLIRTTLKYYSMNAFLGMKVPIDDLKELLTHCKRTYGPHHAATKLCIRYLRGVEREYAQ
jgi:hypothetical protein